MQLFLQKKSYRYSVRNIFRSFSSEDRGINGDYEFRSQGFRKIALLFNITYYTFVTPFCLIKNGDGDYKIHTNGIQKVITSIISGLVLLVRVGSLDPFHSNIIEKPQDLFMASSTIITALLLVASYYIYWRNIDVLEQILTISQTKTNNRKKREGLAYISLLTFVWIGHRICAFGKNISAVGIDGFSEFVYAKVHGVLFKRIGLGYVTSTIFEDLTTKGKVGAIIFCIFNEYSDYVYEMISLTIFMCALMIYQSCDGLSLLLHSANKDIIKIYQCYSCTREETRWVCKFIGIIIPLIITKRMCNFLYNFFRFYSSQPDIYWNISSVIELKDIAFLFLAAEAHHKMSYFKEWLYQLKSKELFDSGNEIINRDENWEQIFQFLWQSSDTQIGLSCGSRFTITYGFIGMLLSIYVTYLFLQLQFYGGKLNEEWYEPGVRQNTTTEV